MESDEVDFKAVWDTFKRQRKFIGLTIMLWLALAALYLVLVTPIFSSSALILVEPVQKDLLDPTGRENANQLAVNARVESEVEILRSDAVALEVVRVENLLRDPEFGNRIGLIEKIERVIGIERERDISPDQLVRKTVDRLKEATEARRRGVTYLIEVSVSSESPERSAQLSNSLAEVYITQQLTAKVQDAFAARDVLQAQIEASLAELAVKETALDSFIQDNVERIERETGRLDLSAIVASLRDTGGSRLKTEVRLRNSQANLRSRNWTELVSGLEDEALSSLEQQRSGIEQRLGRVVSGSQESFDLRSQLNNLEAQLEEQASQNIASLQSRLAELSADEDAGRKQLRDTLVSGQLPSDLLAEVFAIQQSASSARSQYQNLIARLNDVETRAGVQVADSRIVSPALVPTKASFPNTSLVLVVSLILGSVSGAALAFLREFVVGGFSSQEQLQSFSQLPSVVTIPLGANLPADCNSPADAITRAPLSQFSESFRRLQASIDHTLNKNWQDSAEALDGRVILVSSSVSGEGKTTTSLSLARTYALSGKSVLLIDADLRRPAMHRVAGVTPDQSFIEFLENKSGTVGKISDLATDDPETDVALLLGNAPSNLPTYRLLSSPKFEKLIAKARKTYDCIVIDSPPILPVVDGQYIAPLADMIILLARWASTSQSDFRNSLDLLQKATNDEKQFMAVLTQASEGQHYQYGYYGRDTE